MSGNDSTFGVAVVGCGTVGSAVAAALARDQALLRAKMATALELRHIVDIDYTRAREAGLDERLFRESLDDVLKDESVGAVMELIGGTTDARDVIERSIRAGKHVVTANKALLAHHGTELCDLARENGVCIAFEASCAGGVPIIRALCSGLVANRIDAVYGIVNGTCNYILTEMTTRGRSYAEALAEAQRDGLAEADPTLDVAGTDSAHKLAIIAALAFRQRIEFDAIPISGIDSLELCDIANGQELGYVAKLLAIGQRQKEGLSLRVGPAFISKEHPLAWVSGPFNAVSVYGHATGHTMYYGRGAGGVPTASAVVADLASIAMGSAKRQFDDLRIMADLAEGTQLPVEAIRSRYYIRMRVQDAPGVLGKIAAILGRLDISICSVLQHEPSAGADPSAGVPLVITTYKAQEGAIRKALSEIDALDVVKASCVCIGIVDEHPEQL